MLTLREKHEYETEIQQLKDELKVVKEKYRLMQKRVYNWQRKDAGKNFESTVVVGAVK